MFKQTNPTHLKIGRGLILRLIYLAANNNALNPDAPTTMNKTILVMSMEDLQMLPSENDLRSNIRYLEEKGYVTADWLHDGSGDFKWVKLEPSGTDLVEGSISDPGVLFQRRQA
ncbi:hypothetical protein [Deinococcus cellulosilyticus]|uniref:Uncharacterized protein n=1 Tax=Deinococcus cellulosilyticus (strain DSM 18568 / NBRC 106333 / KACC 11606 / 5516J-15) TaxID=1223518 RepID=A0A511N7K2_DEIC1|nr:hypothetical protein [Deinococcus cellulosilyticus]GEM48822.1 hypothetical protein DC3_44570 [Deinococcus cellulosilyticus NBRC 106333 = KACC 11606]